MNVFIIGVLAILASTAENIKINQKIRAGKKLTKKEEIALEEYENTHTDNEFNLIIGLDREMTTKEKIEIIKTCTAALKSLGYSEIDMAP